MNEFKKSKYTLVVKCDDALILYNTLNGSMIYLSEPKYIDQIINLFSEKNLIPEDKNLFEKLYQSNFILDKSINENEIANLAFLNRYKVNKQLKLLIYVTNDCNFNCIYCPQIHTPTYMTNTTIDSLCASVENLIVNSDFNSISISWFGGEPLLNFNVIERGMMNFLKIAKTYDLSIHSGITTNGYFLTKVTVQKLFELKVLEYQITLDGLETAHNKNRILKNGEGTWNVIWNNLLSMKEKTDKFYVNLRINVNIDNATEAIALKNMVNLYLDSRFVVRIQPIVNMGNPHPNVNYCSALESQIIQLNLYDFLSENNDEDTSIEYTIDPFGLMCNSSDPNYFVIKEDGHIYKCELKVEDPTNCIGYIDKNKFSINSFKIASYVTPSTSSICMEIGRASCRERV